MPLGAVGDHKEEFSMTASAYQTTDVVMRASSSFVFECLQDEHK